MKSLKAIGLLILLVATRTLTTYGQEAHLQILLMPSFQNPSTLTITDKNNELSIAIQVHDTVKSVTEQKSIRNEEISVLTKFFKNYTFTRKGSIDTISVDKVIRPNGDTVLAYMISAGLDGITIEGNYNKRHFEFWSPRKDTENHKLMEMIFRLMNSSFSKPEIVRYIKYV